MPLIVTDLDNTLLLPDKTISPKTAHTLARCRESGIKVAYATGRGSSALTMAPTSMFDACIRMNGAVAYIGDQLIYSRTFPVSSIRKLLLAAIARGLKVVAEYNDTHYAGFDVNTYWPSIGKYNYADFTTFEMVIEKAYILTETQADCEFICANMPQNLYYYVDEIGIVYISHAEAIKSKAIAAIAKHWGIAPRDIIAFGDGLNDIDMLKFCGIGVAMGNAFDGVKAVANSICDTNENDGLAKWIEDNVL